MRTKSSTMGKLFESLKKATSEEDVKDIYIKFLKLKEYQKNLIDIQTKEIWFEAKVGKKNSTYAMFTQLLHYVQDAINRGEHLPAFLCVIDSVKAAIMETKIALPLLQDKSVKIKWGKSASDVTLEALETVSQYIGTHFVTFSIEHNEQEFLETVKNAISKGEILRTQITPDNLKQVFDKWVAMIGCEISNACEQDYVLLFYADIMSDGTVSTHENLSAELIHRNNKPAFLLNGKIYDLGNFDGYRKFWAIYDRPPKQSYRNYLLERRDCLKPYDERAFRGDFYTPLNIVDKAYDLLNRTLGNNWQKDYIVWDMCCGVGNLETKHSNPRNIYMSTLEQDDINIMNSTKTCVQAVRFQYDYLNDDIADDGTIDYSLTNKIPQSLQKAIADSKIGKKKILVLINPPYGEAMNADNTSMVKQQKNVKSDSKKNIAKTKFAINMNGYTSRELFVQFIMRVAKEIPNATLAIFSTMKYINAPNFEKFRDAWNAEYLDGFIFHSTEFDGVNGHFPIGFLIWKTKNYENIEKTNITDISCEILNDNDLKSIGEHKFYNISSKYLLNNWIKRPKTNKEKIIPLKNAVSPATNTKDVRGSKGSDNWIACMMCKGNDFQNAGKSTALYSSGYGSAGAFFVNPENLWKTCIVFTVRKIIPQTWLNDRDQFLQPNCELSEEFKNDCLVWMLFNDSNLTASADDLEWDNKKWSIVNHFIPFTEEEVGANDRFESDFMVQYMQGKTFSKEAQTVLDEGKKIWKKYFETNFNHKIRDKYKLNRADVGWYQIRFAIKDYNTLGENIPISFDDFEKAYDELTEKLRPQVYSYGFLKN